MFTKQTVQSDFTLQGLFNTNRIKDAKGIVSEEQNAGFLNLVEEVGMSDSETIKGLAETYEATYNTKIHPAMIQQAEDWMNLSDEVKKTSSITQNFIDKNASGFSKLGAGIKKMGANIGSTLKNVLISGLISWLATELLSVGFDAIDELINGEENKRKESLQKTSSAVSTYKQESASLDELKTKYGELSEQLKKTDISTSELVSTKEQLAGIQDTLVEKYGYEAEGIDLVNGKYDDQIAKLDILQKKKALNLTADAFEKKGSWLDSIMGTEKSDYQRNKDIIMDQDYDHKVTFDVDGYDGSKSAEEILGFDIGSILDNYKGLSLSRDENGYLSFNIDEGYTKKQADDLLNKFYEELDKKYPNNPKVQKFKEDISDSLSFDPIEYEQAENTNKDITAAVLQTGDKESIIDKLNTATTEYNEALAEYEATGTKESYDKYKEARENLTNLQNMAKGDLETYDKSQAEKMTRYGLWDDYYKLVQDQLDKQNKNPYERMEEKFEGTTGAIKHQWDTVIKYMDDTEYQMLEDLLPEDVGILTLQELQKIIDEAKRMAAEADIKLKVEPDASDLVEDLSTFESKIGSLQTVYNSAVTENKTPSASDLQGVNDNFGGIGKNSEGVYNPLSSAIERYNKGIVENVGDSKKAQEYTNDLATAYLDLSGTLEDTIDQYGEYAEEILEAQGIENAEKVVQSRLNKTYKATRQNLEDLGRAVAEYGEQFENSVEGSQDYKDAVDAILPSVKKLVGLYDQTTGEFLSEADIDGQFLADNWDLVQDAIHGVDGALDELYAKVAMADAEKVWIDAGMDLSEYQADMATLEELVNYANQQDINTWAYVQDQNFYPALQKLMASSQAARDACNAAFSDIGMDISYDTTPKTIKVPVVNENGSKSTTVYGGKNAGQTVHWDTKEITVDQISIKASKNGGKGTTGVGAKVNSAPSSGSSGGGGGGGGSDSSDNDTANEDSEETFDWIEVAIQRIEEDISRLDTVIEDVYSGWGERNDKITEKIKKLTQEIEAQTTAYEEYMNYANKKIQINDGKAPNADDYENGTSDVQYTYDKAQYDEAVSQWATGEYQKKVREGLMTGEDIEKIQNQYLVEAINAYKEYYEKAIAAQDKVKELEITKKDQYKQLFENLIEEYEDDVTNIEKKADIINERISRTEELGFFVDKSYYDKLIEYEKQKNQQYATELQKVVNQFNTAVNEGKIQKGTAAWDEMYQQVMDVNKGYEESNTELVKLNNTIRQLQWDKFDWLEERLDDISAEADWLIGLLQGEDNYNDKGFLNNRGFAQAALVGAKYNSTLEKQQRYKEQIADIDKKLATNEGKNDKNLIARKEELLKVYRDSISAAEEEKKAMQSLVRDGISKHIEALTELIDKYKESLSDAKDLYEYQKNLTNQTKTIADLEKQLAAYQGDDSEETRKKRQELQKQLNDAQQQLEETEWDRYISETNQMLDDMKTDYEKYLNDQTESITKVMMDMIPYINDNKTAIQNGLNEIKTEYGITTQHFEDFANTQDGILSVFRNGDFASKLTGIHDVIKDFKTEMAKVTDTSNNGILGIVEKQSKDVSDIAATLGVVDSTNNPNKPKDNGTKGSKGSGEKAEDSLYGANDGTWKKDAKGDWYQYGDGSYAKNEYIDGYWLNSEGYWDSSWDGSWKRNDQGYWWEYSDGSYPTNEWLKINGDWYYFDESGYMVTGKQTIGGKSYTFGKYGDWLGYAKGTKASPRDQLAWTQENASELIYRTSDGAMLTPLNRGDMVFTHDMSQRLWEIAKGNIPTTVGLAVPNVGSSNVRNVTSNNNITIELPNVENYNDFKREMKQDKELEKFWQEITIGQAMGNNTLKKNRY